MSLVWKKGNQQENVVSIDVAGKRIKITDIEIARLFGHDSKLISKHWNPTPGSVFVDIGTGPGTWSLYSAAAGCHVIAFDPKPQSFQMLKSQLALNEWLDQCTLIQKGCWSETGEVPFGINSCLGREPGDVIATSIPVVSLDDYVLEEGVPRIDGINIDAEWSEVEIIKGSISTLKRFHPKIIIEIHDESFRPIIAEQLRNLNVGYLFINEPGFLIAQTPEKNDITGIPPDELFDRHYFDGGAKVGGYAFPGYRDFFKHDLTIQHILARKPESVLEIGCARGYLLKRLQDLGIPAYGYEVSKHCYLTRACNEIKQWNICKTMWPVASHVHCLSSPEINYTYPFDLCFSAAVLEHIPEEHLPNVIKEMQRTCKRGLHGVDFGLRDDGFDKTHCTLRDANWWKSIFTKYAPDWPVEIVDKEELEKGIFPKHIKEGDGKLKINVGCGINQFYYGWENLDIGDFSQWTQHQGYKFRQIEVRNGLPYQTGTVDLIFASHFLEHLNYEQGGTFLRECRRVIKPDTGAMRIIVPDGSLLIEMYQRAIAPNYRGVTCWNQKGTDRKLEDFDEINEGCASSPTPMGKLHSLLNAGHGAIYDGETLVKMLEKCGFTAKEAYFRHVEKWPGSRGSECYKGQEQILKETIDVLPSLSLFVDALPSIDGR